MDGCRPSHLGLCDDRTPALPGPRPADGGEAAHPGGGAHGASFSSSGIPGCRLLRLSRRVRTSLVSHKARDVRRSGSPGDNRRGGPAGAHSRGAGQGALVRCHRAPTGARLAGAQLRRRCRSLAVRRAQPGRWSGRNLTTAEDHSQQRLYPRPLSHVPADTGSNAYPQAHPEAQEDQASACALGLTPCWRDAEPAHWSFAVPSWFAARSFASC